MGLFSFTQELAMDLGTANTIITCNDKMVVDEPSVIALDARSEKVLAVGRQAREMYEKTNPNIRTIRPLREGVIADFYAAEQMMRCATLPNMPVAVRYIWFSNRWQPLSGSAWMCLLRKET